MFCALYKSAAYFKGAKKGTGVRVRPFVRQVLWW